MSELIAKTLREVGNRTDAERQIMQESWPEFMRHDSIGNDYFMRLFSDLPDYQFTLWDGDTVVATCQSIPVTWDLDTDRLSDSGWDWALETGFGLLEHNAQPTTLCAIGIQIGKDYLGKGISKQAVLAMKQIAVEHGFNALIAPVRPTLKHRYPLTPMDRYIRWTRDDGAPFDSWLRTHWNVGASIIKTAPYSMQIPGTVAEWESWTDLKFPESGEYVVPGALNPVSADLEQDRITYVEPNVWMHHPVTP